MNITNCPRCGSRVISESHGWICDKCNGFIAMDGVYHERVQRPFIPPTIEMMHTAPAECPRERCKWYREGRYQKCSCCARNFRNLKDCYEEAIT